MRWTSVLAALVALAVVAPGASARERVGRVAPESAGLPVRKPFPPRFEIRYEPCPTAPWALGCADVESGIVYLDTDDRFTRWHELGHLFDWQLLTDTDRTMFTRLLGFDAETPWWSDDAMYDRIGISPSEQFADAYASCALGRSPAGHGEPGGRTVVEWATGYDYYPTVRQHQRICNAIGALAHP